MRHRLFASAPSPSLFLRCVAYGSARAFVSRPFQDGVNERAHRDTGRRADAFDENASGGLDRGRDLEAGQRKSKHVRSGTTQAKERRQGQGRNVRSPSRLSLSLSRARAPGRRFANRWRVDRAFFFPGLGARLHRSRGFDGRLPLEVEEGGAGHRDRADEDSEEAQGATPRQPSAAPPGGRAGDPHRPHDHGECPSKDAEHSQVCTSSAGAEPSHHLERLGMQNMHRFFEAAGRNTLRVSESLCLCLSPSCSSIASPLPRRTLY